MSVISTKYIKNGKDYGQGYLGCLIQETIPDEEFYPKEILIMKLKLENFELLEPDFSIDKNRMFGDGLFQTGSFSVLGETDFNKQKRIIVSIIKGFENKFEYSWRQKSDFLEIYITADEETFLNLKNKMFIKKDCNVFLRLFFQTKHFYENKTGDIVILRYPGDLVNLNELPNNFEPFDPEQKKVLKGSGFDIGFQYFQMSENKVINEDIHEDTVPLIFKWFKRLHNK